MRTAPPASTPFGRLIEELAAGARADRDGVFNTLDAINRQTRAVSDRLADQVDQFLAVTQPQSEPAAADQHDARFDPEDEWELAPAEGQPRHTAQPSGTAPTSVSHDDDDDLPETWLR